MKIVILGIQGSGKGTQAQLLEKTYGWKHISGGDLLREEEHKGTALARQLRTTIDKGLLVPDEIIHSLLLPYITHYEHFILDGYPRTLKEAILLDKTVHIDKVIHLILPEQEVYKRLQDRRECVRCHTTYNHAKPEQRKGYCDFCNTLLTTRADDTPEGIQQRIEIYHTETEPVLNYYKKKGILEEVDGTPEPKTIFNQLRKLFKTTNTYQQS
ncbi:MAG TPA: nucleoside monophosphate kinase [Candidatus Nanoarchaeia archaeon]|nr:nucleoside monophosphate kinase [Candidatus Nanoarchaeia archaeon]